MADYYKMSDVLFKFDENTELKFNSVFFFDDKMGNPIFFHKEFQFKKTSYNSSKDVKTARRHPFYFITIENKSGNVKTSIKLTHGDFYQFKIAYKNISSNSNDIAIQIESGAFIGFKKVENSIIIDFNTFKVMIKGFEMISLLAILEDINMLNLWNYHVQYVSSSNYIGDDRLSYNFTVNQMPEMGVQTNSNKVQKPYDPSRKKSFFD